MIEFDLRTALFALLSGRFDSLKGGYLFEEKVFFKTLAHLGRNH